MGRIVGADGLQILIQTRRRHKHQTDSFLSAEIHDFFYIRDRIRRIQLHVIGHFSEIVPPGNGLRIQLGIRPHEAPACVPIRFHRHRRVAAVAFCLLFLQIFLQISQIAKLLPVAPEGKKAVRVIFRLRGGQQEGQLIPGRPHIIGNDVGLHQIPVFRIHEQEFIVHVQVDRLQVVQSGRLPQQIVGGVVVLRGRSQVIRRLSGQFFVEGRIIGPVTMGTAQK